MFRYLLTGAALLALAGCSHFGHAPAAQPVHYRCGTLPLTVTLAPDRHSVSLLLDGEQLHLTQVEAASGARYSDGRYTFWSQGARALVQRGDDVIINDCVVSR
ncbi:MliC family protein [Nissabacter sp. SGAir0207]|uniref:MliC family protein n=1 Tax=Nissabacter sp. SGAir0207 TaxID=2126321 RepID=UPI0010CD1964|nr:MliC family protein [Nissabacter sp. SGAir0207]QCR36267.1 lysozyme inhibitor [Nissabacter sp. SGAir0207]